jgi:hypothetical protein
MHGKASSELQITKEALQKSQEARVRAEVSAEGNSLLHLMCAKQPPHMRAV